MSIWKRIDNFGFRTFGNVARWLCWLTGFSSHTVGTFLLHVWFVADAGYWILLDNNLGDKMVGVFGASVTFVALRFISERVEGGALVYVLMFPRVYGLIFLAWKTVLFCLGVHNGNSVIYFFIWTVATLAVYMLSLNIPKKERKEWAWSPKPKTA